MTKNRDFKKLVRARMEKTGESYTAARAQLAAPSESATPDEYADIAGISDQSVAAKTGRTWSEWVAALDTENAVALSHKQIATLLGEKFEIGPWWRQSVTVGYERIRGTRVKGQLCTGAFAASKSKTFPVPVTKLFQIFRDEREHWMGMPTEIRTSTLDRSLRLTWPDGTIVSAWFTDKGASKSSVAIQHEKLASSTRRDAEKESWGQRFSELARRL